MKIVRFGQDARDSLQRGIAFCAKATNPTLGHAGRAAVLGRPNLPPRIADDAISILMNIEAEDPFENEAIMLMREALSTTSKTVRDATATTMNLSNAIVSSLFDKLKTKGSLVTSQKVNTIKLKKELDIALAKITDALRAQARPMTKEDTYNVALTAGSYEWIAKLVTEVFDHITVDGYVEIQEAKKTSLEILNGMDVKAGYMSEYLINNENREGVFKNAMVLVTNQILEVEALKKVVAAVFPNKDENQNRLRNVVIVAPDFTRDTITQVNITLTETDPEFKFTPITLKLPTFDKDDVLVDIATLTGAKFLDKKLYKDYEALKSDIVFENLGRVEKVIVSESKTKLIGGKGDVSGRIAELKDKAANTQSVYDKDVLEKRIASLSGGTAYIKLGGVSDFERDYLKLKLENAIGAVQNAMREGVVQGGGMALKLVSDQNEQNILSEAIKSPYLQMQENNGDPFEVPNTVIDPVANTIGALTSACSIAGTLLLTETLSVDKPEHERKGKDED